MIQTKLSCKEKKRTRLSGLWVKILGQASSNNFQSLKSSRKDGSERELPYRGILERQTIVVQFRLKRELRSAGTSTLPATLYPADGSVDASIGQAEA
jgi:hypothetical protein